MARKTRAYGLQRPLEDVFPVPIVAARAPTTSDTNFDLGQLWIFTTTGQIYGLANVASGSATWSVLGPGASDVDTLTGDSGGAISPVAGNITMAGGTNLTTVGAAGTITFNLDAAISLATSVTSPIYTASAADLNINSATGQDIIMKMGDNAGANKVSFTDSDDAEVFSIDSNGSIGTLAGLTVTGAFTTSGGAASINASSNFNTVINSGTSTGTVTIGNGAAGAITVDTAAGISLDSATASNFTVTGAADLTLASTAGSVDITSGEAAATDSILLNATAADGGVTIDAGSSGILVGISADCTPISIGDIVPTSARTITVGGGAVATAIADTIDIGPDGANTDAGASKVVTINNGGVTLGTLTTNIGAGAVTSGTHTVNIQSGNAAAGTVATNISTGTGTKTVNLGNADALTTLNIDAITLINDSVNAATSINSGTSTGAVTIGNAAAGVITIDTDANFSINGDDNSTISVTAGTLDLDSSGALAINSSAGVINIGNDAVAQNINIGTGAAARTITIGNATGASSVVVDVGTGAASFGASATVHTTTIGSTTGASATVIQSGTGEITLTGTVKEVASEFAESSGVWIDEINCNPVMSTAANTGGAPTGATGATNLMALQNGVIMEQFILGAGQTIIAPRMDANGLLISLDLTAAEGAEYNFGARDLSKCAFTIGTDAAFFFEVDLYINDMDGADPYIIGFRKSEANNATFGNYTDYAAIGMIASTSATNIVTVDELNSGGQTITNTTDAWGGDGSTNTLRVLVSAAGVVTYTINGVAASAAGAITFDNADVVIPFIRLTHSASATQVNIVSMKCGYQA